MINVSENFFKISLSNPHKTAVVLGNEKISYKELASRVDVIAARLDNTGIKSETLVGLHLPRSVDLIATILAILKIGAGYVPLDVSFPSKRIRHILADSGIKFVVTDKNLTPDILSGIDDLNSIYVNDDDTYYKKTKLKEGEIAYVIYTSGSTGLPKGIKMGHKALANLIDWQDKNSRISSGITLQYAPVSFDVSFQEIFSTLSFGGTLVLCGENLRRNPENLLQLIISEKIERIFLPFVALQQIAEISKKRKVPHSLHEVIVAGEQLRVTPAIRSFFEALPNCKLINQYGPTETHVVTAYELMGNIEEWPSLPPIGKPIQNVEVFVYDDYLKEVSVNEIGELYISGVCLAHGYMNPPVNSGFISHPATKKRMYKTGDLVRSLSDGNLEFVGRKDDQVKISGYRVEIGEIEAVLSEHPILKECAISVKKDILGQNQLVAYLVVREAERKEVSALHNNDEWVSFLKERIPDYMIPSFFVKLPFLPLTPTGKVDRRSLPDLSNKRPNLFATLVLPRDDIESKISGIWREVLQLDEVGIDDNFFELGGNSLLVTYMLQKLLQTFESKITIADLFQYPTIRLISEKIKKMDNKSLNKSRKKYSKIADMSMAEKRINARKNYGK